MRKLRIQQALVEREIEVTNEVRRSRVIKENEEDKKKKQEEERKRNKNKRSRYSVGKDERKVRRIAQIIREWVRYNAGSSMDYIERISYVDEGNELLKTLDLVISLIRDNKNQRYGNLTSVIEARPLKRIQ